MFNMKTFIITLPNSRRKPIIEKQMNDGGFDFSFTDGISKKDITIDWTDKIFKTDKYAIKLNTNPNPVHPHYTFFESFGTRQWIKIGEIGLFIAHFDLWVRLCDDPENDAYMILEDDAKFLFTPQHLEVFRESVNVNSFDVIQNQKVSPNFMNGKVGFNNLSDTVDSIPFDNQIWQNTEGTATYIISKQGAAKMIEFYKRLGLFCPVDNFITRAYMLQFIKMYYPPNYLQAGLNEESAISEIHVPVEDLGVLDGILIKG